MRARHVSLVALVGAALGLLARCSPLYGVDSGATPDAAAGFDAGIADDGAVEAACDACVGDFIVAPEQTFPFALEGATTVLDGDFDGDGLADLYVGARSATTSSWYILYGTPAGAFVAGARQTHPLSAPTFRTWADTTLRAADVDGDHITDLVFIATSASGLAVHVARGTSSRAFTFRIPQTISAATGWMSFTFDVGDVTGDGCADLVAAYAVTSSTLQSTSYAIYSQPATADFAAPVYANRGAGTWSGYQVQVVDSNGDGKLDIARWGGSVGAALFVDVSQPGATPFYLSATNADPRIFPELLNTRLLAPADVDGDLVRDIVFAGTTKAGVSISPRDAGVDAGVATPTIVAFPDDVLPDHGNSGTSDGGANGGMTDVATARLRGIGSELAVNRRANGYNVTQFATWRGNAYAFGELAAFAHPAPRAWADYQFRAIDVDGNKASDLVWIATIGTITRVEVARFSRP